MDPPNPQRLQILVAPCGPIDGLQPEQIAEFIEEGVRKVFPGRSAYIERAPFGESGVDFYRGLSAYYTKTTMIEVLNQIGDRTPSHLGLLADNRIGVLDVEAIITKTYSGPAPSNSLRCRAPSYGVGQLLVHALDAGCTHIVLQLDKLYAGDEGAGMLHALGVRFLGVDGLSLSIEDECSSISDIAELDMRGLHPRLRGSDNVQIDVVYVDDSFRNPVWAPGGMLLRELFTGQRDENVLSRSSHLGSIVSKMIGDGARYSLKKSASGGLGPGLVLLGAKFIEWRDAINMCVHLDSLLSKPWDLVITSLNKLDRGPRKGMMMEIARRSKQHGVPTVSLLKEVGDGTANLHEEGVTSFINVVSSRPDISYCLADTAKRSMRLVRIGLELAGKIGERP